MRISPQSHRISSSPYAWPHWVHVFGGRKDCLYSTLGVISIWCFFFLNTTILMIFKHLTLSLDSSHVSSFRLDNHLLDLLFFICFWFCIWFQACWWVLFSWYSISIDLSNTKINWHFMQYFIGKALLYLLPSTWLSALVAVIYVLHLGHNARVLLKSCFSYLPLFM